VPPAPPALIPPAPPPPALEPPSPPAAPLLDPLDELEAPDPVLDPVLPGVPEVLDVLGFVPSSSVSSEHAICVNGARAATLAICNSRRDKRARKGEERSMRASEKERMSRAWLVGPAAPRW
jgi:hypothetical protein